MEFEERNCRLEMTTRESEEKGRKREIKVQIEREAARERVNNRITQ